MGLLGIRDGILTVKGLKFRDADFVVDFVVPKLATVSTGAIVTGWNIHGATTSKTNTTITSQPPYPVNLTVIANAVGSAGATDRIWMQGFDARGKYITETVAVQATAAGVNQSSKAFAKIVKLTPSNSAGILPKSTSIGIQFGKKLGVVYPIAGTSAILSINYNNVAVGTQALKTNSVSATNNTITIPVSATAGSLKVTYKTKLQL